MPAAQDRLSVSEAARLLDIGIDYVHRLIYAGKLEAHKVPSGRGGHDVWRISRESIDSYRARRRARAR